MTAVSEDAVTFSEGITREERQALSHVFDDNADNADMQKHFSDNTVSPGMLK